MIDSVIFSHVKIEYIIYSIITIILSFIINRSIESLINRKIVIKTIITIAVAAIVSLFNYTNYIDTLLYVVSISIICYDLIVKRIISYDKEIKYNNNKCYNNNNNDNDSSDQMFI